MPENMQHTANELLIDARIRGEVQAPTLMTEGHVSTRTRLRARRITESIATDVAPVYQPANTGTALESGRVATAEELHKCYHPPIDPLGYRGEK